MCGIAGHYSQSSRFRDIRKALSYFTHRGPDSTAILELPKVHFGYNRLAITDLNQGFQPIFNSDKSVAVFYNGEIYNHERLRKQLASSIKSNISQVDGAVIPYLYEEFGELFVEKLEGMYAIALFDSKKDKLILCRDLVGEKPLYFSQDTEEILFSSSLLGLRSLLPQEPNLDIQGLWDFPSFLWIPEPRTPFESIKSLMPGQTLVFENSILVRSFIQDFVEAKVLESHDEFLIEKLREIIQTSVYSMIPDEVPYGTFLSSGLDSSIITTLVAKRNSNYSLNTFCVEFPNLFDPYHGFANESNLAFEYSKKIGTVHHTLKADSQSILHLLDDFIRYSDSPFAVSSGLGVMMVSSKAQKLGIKVLMSGDGADELYGGYSWYSMLEPLCQKHNKLATNKSIKLDDAGITLQSQSLSYPELLEIISRYSPNEMAFALHYYMLDSEKRGVFSKLISSNIESSYRHMNLHQNGPLEPINFINHDRRFYMTQEMMRKVDRFTMSHSIEGRVPFVGYESLRFATQLPFDKLVGGNVLKTLLKQAFKDTLPPEVITRAKHGFNVPIDYWLRNNWLFLVKSTFCKTSMLAELGIIDESAEDNVLKMISDTSKLNGHSVFSFIVLEKWLQHIYGKNKP